MKEIYSANNVFELHILQDEFQKNGILTEIKDSENAGSFSLKGGLPFPSNSPPSLWILQEERFEEAKQLLEQLLKKLPSPSDSTRGWLCSQCKETNPEGFELCWKCGAAATQDWVNYRDISKDPMKENPNSKNEALPSKRPYLIFVLLLLAGFASGYYFSRYQHQMPPKFDNNLDGKYDEFYRRSKGNLVITRDANFDGEIDQVTFFDSLHRRISSVEDTNFDGKWDIVIRYKYNLPRWSKAYQKSESGEKLVSVKHYYNGILAEEWVDDNEDGAMDTKITFDYLGKIKTQETIAADKADEWKRPYDEDQRSSPQADSLDQFNSEDLSLPPQHPLQFQ